MPLQIYIFVFLLSTSPRLLVVSYNNWINEIMNFSNFSNFSLSSEEFLSENFSKKIFSLDFLSKNFSLSSERLLLKIKTLVSLPYIFTFRAQIRIYQEKATNLCTALAFTIPSCYCAHKRQL